MIRVMIITLITILPFASGVLAGLDPSFSEQAVIDTVPFYSGGTYNDAIPRPNDYLENPVGEYPSRYHEIVPYLEALAAASDRVVLESYGSTHEGRKLFNLFVSSEENISNLQQLRESMNLLADPAPISDKAELNRLFAELPAFAWMGYCVHGDEISAMDGALQLVYQLAAGTDERTLEILDHAVVIVDPIQNPDGRERYLSMLQTYQSHVPNYNRRAMQHQGVWPWGRANHYLFDLNRDWILLTQPETRGKVATIQKWHPQLIVDAHEMDPNATFLFSPPRRPVNYNIAGNIMKWYDIFSQDQASAFDERGWPYYTGEWNDQWYPGYGSAWSTFFGAIGILYEMAGVDGKFVKQQDDYLLTYHEAVNKQFTSSMTNLTTLVKNREAILRDYRDARKEIVAMGKKSGLTFLIVPDRDELKTRRFVDRLIGQGIEVHRAPSGFSVGSVKDMYGANHASKKFPAGTYVVTTAQVNGALARTALEFDLHLKKDFLEEERRELEKFNETKMYEVSAWSVSLAYDMDIYQTTSQISAKLEPVTEIAVSSGKLINPNAQFGFVIDMVGEKTYQMLIRLFAKDLVLFASEKAFTIEGKSFAPGSIVIRKRGNKEELVDILTELAEEVGLDIHGVHTGRSTKGSLLGAPTFQLLSSPKVAIVTGDGMNYTSVGSLWFTLDKELELPHSLINLANLGGTTLSQYNVLVLPASWGSLSSRLGDGGKRNLEKWVQAGGTLICTGASAAWAADTSSGLSQVRLKRQMLDSLEKYDTAADRERTAERPLVDTIALWHPDRVQAKKENDKSEKESAGKVSKEDDEWQRRFHPRGVILKAELDNEDWLTFGMKESVPVMAYTSHAFLAKPPVRTVARFADENELRLSGLLWPEARERWANTVYATRESKSSGQIILLATDPNPRAYFYGTRKLFVNAVLYGPGMGTRFEGPYEQEE